MLKPRWVRVSLLTLVAGLTALNLPSSAEEPPQSHGKLLSPQEMEQVITQLWFGAQDQPARTADVPVRVAVPGLCDVLGPDLHAN